MTTFAATLDQYMDLILRVGVNLQPDQTVAFSPGSGVPLDLAETVRHLTRRAYALGAGNVQVVWRDLAVERLRIEHASLRALETASRAQVARTQELIDEHAAFVSLVGWDPDAFAGVDSTRMATTMRAQAIASMPVQQQIASNVVPWVVAAVATPAWASKVFPTQAPDEAVSALWSHIFHATRADTPDPVAAWSKRVAELEQRVAALGQAHFARLRYRGPGTDLVIQLPAKHQWIGGGDRDSKGIFFVPNLPTEEVFSLPTRDGVDGVVRGTMPVQLQGTLVEGLSLRFERGRVVECSARTGQDALANLIDTDDGAHYLGEVALVTADSPTYASFPLYQALFDENVTCHLALGNAYPNCLEGGTAMTPEQLAAAGANSSAAHWDFMVGSADLEIDGESADGTSVPIIRGGAWVLA